MHDSSHPLTALLWTLLASFAGALTALSFRPFKDMTRGEIALALFVGASFAIFVGPLVAGWIYGDAPVNIRVFGAICYLMASGSNILIPIAIKKLASLFGVKQGEAE